MVRLLERSSRVQATILKFHFSSEFFKWSSLHTLLLVLVNFYSPFQCLQSCFPFRVLTTPTSRIEFDFDAIDDEDSPYPEVRASVSNIDDPDMPAMTIRMWFVGLLLCMTSTYVFLVSFDVLIDSSHGIIIAPSTSFSTSVTLRLPSYLSPSFSSPTHSENS